MFKPPPISENAYGPDLSMDIRQAIELVKNEVESDCATEEEILKEKLRLVRIISSINRNCYIALKRMMDGLFGAGITAESDAIMTESILMEMWMEGKDWEAELKSIREQV
jgi:hypothetical protein